jgi:hypothetical protein
MRWQSHYTGAVRACVCAGALGTMAAVVALGRSNGARSNIYHARSSVPRFSEGIEMNHLSGTYQLCQWLIAWSFFINYIFSNKRQYGTFVQIPILDHANPSSL